MGQRRCFIASPSETATHALLHVLAARGVALVDDAPTGESVLTRLSERVRRADFVVGVLSSEPRTSPAVAFALGAAWACKKPVLLVAYPDTRGAVPDELVAASVGGIVSSSAAALAVHLDDLLERLGGDTAAEPAGTLHSLPPRERRLETPPATASATVADGERLLGVAIQAEGREVGDAVFGAGTITIGRDRAAAVHLPDDSVSTRHALAHFDGSNVAIEDIGSLNGTLVNGQLVEARTRTTITDGDTIEIKPYVLRFTVRRASQRVEMPPQLAAPLPRSFRR